jgi:hypothetical protein
MEQNDYLEHLQGIKGLIEERTKFKALSGLSGVIAGIFALLGAYTANHVIYSSETLIYSDIKSHDFSVEVQKLIIIAAITLLCAVSTGLFFSMRNAKKKQSKLWTPAAVKAVINFTIPMAIGGVFVLALIWRGYYILIAPSCLIFYGLALVNAANFTFSDIKALGIALLITGGLSLFLPGNGLLLWAFGFGVLHIIYGAIMYFKYEQ